MKKIITTMILALLSSTAFAADQQAKGVTYGATLLRVTDGDTVVMSAAFLPAPLKPELAIRVYGVDTPEKGFRAKCESEAKRGLAATQFTKQQILAAKDHKVTIIAWDKFGGRVLGDILLDGKSLRQMLIQNGFAREYYGEAKTSWC